MTPIKGIAFTKFLEMVEEVHSPVVLPAKAAILITGVPRNPPAWKPEARH
jgi:hypothetical protein